MIGTIQLLLVDFEILCDWLGRLACMQYHMI
jgi:hypothetical protein